MKGNVLEDGLSAHPAVAGQALVAAGPLALQEAAGGEDAFGGQGCEVAVPYVVALSRRGKVLRLHRGDGCWWARNLAFQSFELVDLSPVPEHMYTSYCSTCWPRAAPARAGPSIETLRSDSSGGESTDSTAST